MEKKASVKINYIFSLAYQILSIIAPIITTPYISRVLGPEGIGIYSYTGSIVSYFTMVGVLGLGTYGQLTVAKVKENRLERSKIFCNIACTRVILHAVCLIAYLGLIICISENKIIYIIQIITFFASMLDVTWFFQGIEEFKDVAIKNIVIKLATVICIFAFVKNNNDLAVYVLINALSTFISSAYFIPRVKRYVNYIKPARKEIFKHIKNGLLYFVPTIASVIVSMLDKTMLGLIAHSDTQNGYYAEAYKIVLMAITVFTSLNMVMRSRMAYISAYGDENEIVSKMKLSLKFVMMLAWPMSFGLTAIASIFVPSFLGEAFRPSILLFEVMAWWIVFKAISNCLLEQYIVPVLTIKKASVVAWAGAITDFILNLILIPKYQALGAVVASLITELVILVAVMLYCKQIIKYIDLITMGWKYIIGAAVMFGLLVLMKQYVPENMMGTIILLVSGAAVYVVILLLVKDELLTTGINTVKNRLLKKRKE